MCSLFGTKCLSFPVRDLLWVQVRQASLSPKGPAQPAVSLPNTVGGQRHSGGCLIVTDRIPNVEQFP